MQTAREFPFDYREHLVNEEGAEVDLSRLLASPLDEVNYSVAHAGLVIVTHDAVITYNGGVVLLERTGAPLNGFIWLPGGRLARGIPAGLSLYHRVKSECGIEIANIEFAGIERAFMRTDPFGHGKGTDTIGLVYFADGDGEVAVDQRHKNLRVVTPPDYKALRGELHPFMQKYTDEAIRRITESHKPP